MDYILIKDEYSDKIILGFINSDGYCEYTTYLPDDGGVIAANEDDDGTEEYNLIQALLSEANYPEPTVCSVKEIK